MKKNKLIDKIAIFILYLSMLLLIVVSFAPVELNVKQIIAPIAITLFGLSVVTLLFSGFLDLKSKDFEYFRNVLIGIFGGLTVWIFSTIDFSFPNGIMLGINEIITKLGFGILILTIGYHFIGRKK